MKGPVANGWRNDLPFGIAKPSTRTSEHMNAPLASILFLVVLLFGCTSPEVDSTKDLHVDKKPHPVAAADMALDVSLVQSHRITVEALTDLNWSRTIEVDSYIKAKTGTGEVVEIFLEELGPQKTQLWIRSHRTFVGGAWQIDRRNDVIWAIKRVMSPHSGL